MQIDFDGSTYEIDNEIIHLTFAIDEVRLTILNIEVIDEGYRLGTNIIKSMHQFAEEIGLEVWASKVKDEARDYWEDVLSYVESETPGEYYYPY